MSAAQRARTDSGGFGSSAANDRDVAPSANHGTGDQSVAVVPLCQFFGLLRSPPPPRWQSVRGFPVPLKSTTEVRVLSTRAASDSMFSGAHRVDNVRFAIRAAAPCCSRCGMCTASFLLLRSDLSICSRESSATLVERVQQDRGVLPPPALAHLNVCGKKCFCTPEY